MGLPLGLPLGLGEPFFHFRRYIKNVLILYVLLVSIPLFLEKTPNPPGFTFWVYLWVYFWVFLLGLPFNPKPSWVYLSFGFTFWALERRFGYFFGGPARVSAHFSFRVSRGTRGPARVFRASFVPASPAALRRALYAASIFKLTPCPTTTASRLSGAWTA